MTKPIEVHLIEKTDKDGKPLEPREFLYAPSHPKTITSIENACLTSSLDLAKSRLHNFPDPGRIITLVEKD